MKRLLFVFTVLLLAGTTEVYSQGWLEKVAKKTAKRVEERSKKKVEDKVNEAADKTVDKAFGKAEDAVTGKGNTGSDNTTGGETEDTNENAEEGGKQAKKSSTMNWNKFDFVAGDEVMFDDDQANEQMGEFPSQWDALSGSAEIISIDGIKAFELMNRGSVVPLMKEKKYFPEKFTLEYDFYARNGGLNAKGEFGGYWMNGTYILTFYDGNDKKCFEVRTMPWPNGSSDLSEFASSSYYEWYTGTEHRSGETQKLTLTTEAWHHVSISFNQRALKLYIDQTRVISIPNMNKPAYFRISAYTESPKLYFFKNFRIAKGAVPLYDRMMSDGKFITYGITFDVGKSVIKPESMGEINRIVQLMNENPDLKFSVEGHTDSTGNATSNQTLSEARSKAIVDKLVEMGIAADRLTSSGKGQANPIADNATDEGRAKNRRVEFVKI